MKVRVGVATDVGRRRSANEDSYLRRDDDAVFAVADGMGGHRAGDVASATALEALEQRLGDGGDLVEAIVSANAEVFDKARANPEMRGMGTTVTAVRVKDEAAVFGHVGDSRAYLFRDGELTQVTEDHSLVEELVREGRLTPEEAAVHPQRSIVTRALGVDESVDVDTYEVDLLPADRILVCSDGLTSMLRDDQIAEVLRGTADPQAAAENLVEAANRAGGEDNITTIVIDLDPGKQRARKKAMAASKVVEPPADEATGQWEYPLVAGDDEPEDEPAVAARRPRRYRRALLWIVPFLLVVMVAVAAMWWYARSTYYVGGDRGRVVLYQGVPGGFLIWDATVEERTDIRVGDLTEERQADLADGHRFSGERGAELFVERLERSTTTTTTSTTTTIPVPPA